MSDPPRGRFYFWGLRALHLGPGMPAAVHAHYAVQVCIPLSGTMSQDFGFYNLALALLFVLAACDPERSTTVLAVTIALYTIHA